jgi:hypothetical protein
MSERGHKYFFGQWVEAPWKEKKMVKDAYGRDWPLEDMKRCVGEGWSNLIEECYNICQENNVSVLQVKEKYGGLRFYVDAATESVFEVLDKCEEMSYTICEFCGKEGSLRTDLSWYLTLCDEHYMERKK